MTPAPVAATETCSVCGAARKPLKRHRHEDPTWQPRFDDLEGTLEGYETVPRPHLGLDGRHWAVAWLAYELADAWTRKGHVGRVAPHHFSDLELGPEKTVRRILNDLVDAGVMTRLHDSRGRRTWVLAGTWGYGLGGPGYGDPWRLSWV